VVTARREDKLESLASEISAMGGECLALPADALVDTVGAGSAQIRGESNSRTRAFNPRK
jgi:short-subunit dehydrogenase